MQRNRRLGLYICVSAVALLVVAVLSSVPSWLGVAPGSPGHDGLSSSTPLHEGLDSSANGGTGLHVSAPAPTNAADTHGRASSRPMDAVHSDLGASDTRDRPGAESAALDADAASATPLLEDDVQTVSSGPETAEKEAAVQAVAFWQELRQLRAKPLAKLALPPLLGQRYAEFAARYPGVDPTEQESLASHLGDVRARHPFRLNDEQRQAINHAFREAEELGQDLAVQRAQASDIPVNGWDPEGRGFLLTGFVDGQPQYVVTMNERAAISSGSTWLRRSSSFDPPWTNEIDGRGLVVNVNDHGTVYEHPEFTDEQGRKRIIFTGVNDSGDRGHMTHVAGTIAAQGIRSDAIGMVPGAYMRTLIQQWTSHVSGFAAAYPNAPWRSVMGNTSLGSRDAPYGAYNHSSWQFDNVLLDYPYYLHFYAAGNNGSSYHTLSRSQNVSKNVVNIGAASAINRDADGVFESGGGIAGFSSRGPSADGRIKPDLVAQGASPSLVSPTSATGYGTKQGTSMASPNAAGSSVLLMDYFRQRFSGQMMRAATVRALLINTAIDLGNPGPDYTYGWGAIDVLAAAKTIRSYAEDAQTRTLREEVLLEGETHNFTYHSDGSESISVTLVWHEQGGPAFADDRDPVLINNLHLRIHGPDGSTADPFVMPYVVGTDDTAPFDSSLYAADAVTGVNNTDNVLQVALSAPVAGSYTIEVYHDDSLAHEQDYSLAVSGMVAEGLSQPQITAIDSQAQKSIDHQFTLSGEDFILGANVEFRRPDQSAVQAYSAMVHPTSIAVRVDNRSMDPGYWDVAVVNPDGQEAILEGGYLIPAQEVLHATDFSDDDHGWTLEGDWAVHEPTFDPREAAVGTRILSSHPDSNYPQDASPYAYSPVFDLRNHEDATLHMRRWLGVHGIRWQATIDIQINEGSWQRLWESPYAVDDNGWNPRYYSLGEDANGAERVRLRFAIDFDDTPLDPHPNFIRTGWNLDDVQLIAQVSGDPQPPEITSTPETSATAGQAYSYQLTATDPDTELAQLQWQTHALPSWLSLIDHGDGTATLSGTPDGSDQGLAAIHVAVADEYHTTWQSFEIEVTSPLYFTQEPLFAGEASAMHADVAVNMDSGVTLSASNMPSWLSFTDHGDGSGTLSQVASSSDWGARDITITATDGTITANLSVTVYRQMQDYIQVVYPYYGQRVVVLSRQSDLQEEAMQRLLNGLDAGWAYYATTTGREPEPFFAYDGLPTIAEVPNGTTCGAGCGYVGATGIELTVDTFAALYDGVRLSNSFDQAVFYEMGRNFWFYGDQLNYHPDDDQWVTATGYAVFMRFMAMHAAEVTGGPYNGHAFADFEAEVRGLIDTYLADTDKNWENTLRQGSGVTNSMGLGGTDLFASFLFRLTDIYGSEILADLWQHAESLDHSQSTQDAVDNFIRSASAGAQRNLSPLFLHWRWPVPQALQDELEGAYPGGNYTEFTITFPGFTWPEALSDFPLLVRLNADHADFSYQNMAYPTDGRDLRFYAEDGSELPFRMETWDANGESAIWVRVPELHADTTITMRMGDPANDTLPSYTTDASVWQGSPYLSVWNLNEAAGEDRADVRGGRHAQPKGSNTVARVDGIVGGAAGFDGSDGATRLHVGEHLHPSLQFTDGLSVEGWLWIVSGTGDQYRELISQDNAYHRGRGYRVNLNSSRIRTSIGTESGTGGGSARETEDVDLSGGVPEEQWLHIAVVWHQGMIRTYVNGEQLAANSFDHTVDYLAEENLPLVLGAGWHGDNAVQNRSLNGHLDEVRISDQPLSSTWIAATYANIAETSSFVRIAGVSPTSLVIEEQPTAQQVWQGQAIELTVVVSGGAGDISYQWRKDGSDLEAATAATLVIDPSDQTDGGSYQVRISDDDGAILSNAVQVRVLTPRSIRIRRLGDLLWLISPDVGLDPDDGEGEEAEFTPLDAEQEHTLTPLGGSG